MDERRQAGFTLIEVLISMVATVMIVTLAFMTFTNLLGGLEGLRRASSQSHELNRAWMLLSRDLRQFVNRGVRDGTGARESGLFGGESADNSLTFTRIGWHNPNRNLRSHMQRVSYRLEGETLWRESYPVLDRTDETEPSRVELLQGVVDFSLAFLGSGVPFEPGDLDTEKWPHDWGIESARQGNAAPPEAIEVTLEVAGFGVARRLFEMPAVPSAAPGGANQGQQGSGDGQSQSSAGKRQSQGQGLSGENQ